MTKQLIVTCVVILAASTGGSPSAAQTPTTRPPGPLDNLVPTPNPVISPLQVDAAGPGEWRRAMREKYEGKFPGPAPRTPDGKPDLSGIWLAQSTPERPAMTQTALTVLEDRFKTNIKDHPYSVCLPLAPVPADGLWVVMQNRTQLVTLFEFPPNYRLVFLDGRPHPADLDPTWMGHSIGIWEGDTLVVDSIGFNDKSWLGTSSLPHTANMHIRERWTRKTMGAMTLELTYEDPEIFVKPWKVVSTLFLAPGENLIENICENNKFPELSRGQNP